VKFAEVLGQSVVKAHLIQSVLDGRVSHAQLFLGPEGSGALPLALAYATYLNCQSPTEHDACGQCPSCFKYAKLIHPDLHLVFPVVKHPDERTDKTTSAHYMKTFRESFLEDPYISYIQWLEKMGKGNQQGNINKAECYDIIAKLGLHTFEGKYKVVVMWLPEMLKDTGNVLLKIIEEPPANTVFLLVAERQEMLLQTILSRTQLVKIPRLEPDIISQELQRLFDLSEKDAHSIAILSEGNMQTARELVRHDVSVNEELFIFFMRSAYKPNGNELMDWLDKVSDMGREQQKNFLQYGLHILRECLLMQYGSAKLVRLRDEELRFVKDFSPIIQRQYFQDFTRVFNDAIYYIERNANGRIVFHNLANEVERLLALSKKALSTVS
jgi:DNA polymerase-3 subunit delta'